MPKVQRFAATLGFVVVLSCGNQMRGQDQPLVIQGGTLIDGTGHSPVKNAVVVMEGNHFKAVGVKGKVAIPPNAKIIDATGKFILPGLIDAEAQGNWEIQPPQWLYFGFTTVYFGGTPYTRAQQALQEKGQLKGPRMYLSAGIIQAPFELLREDFRTPGSSDLAKRWPAGWSVSTPEEVRAAIEKRAVEGKSYSLHVQEGWTPELLRALTDAAHKHGWTVGGRCEFVSMAAANGQDYSEHMASIVRSTITKPENVAKLQEMRKDHWEQYWPITDGNYQYMMEPDKFDPLIREMVQHNYFLSPTIAHAVWGWGTQMPHAKEWEAEIIDFAKNTPGLDFVPENIRHLWLTADQTSERVKDRYVVGDQVSATHPQDMDGYAKRDEFLRRFVKAGGKIMGGADNSFDTVTGLTTHQELQQLVYSGLTPMQAILSVTKWAAETWHLEKEIGTVEPGKYADVIILNADPLANIKNTRTVDTVILNGKVIDKAFDPKWKNPIPRPQREYIGKQ